MVGWTAVVLLAVVLVASVWYIFADETARRTHTVGWFATAEARSGVDSGGGGSASSGASENVEHGTSTIIGQEEEEEEGERATPPIKLLPITMLPDEVVLIIFSNLDAKTLMVSIPQVCKLWRTLCQGIQDVRLDFSWWGGRR